MSGIITDNLGRASGLVKAVAAGGNILQVKTTTKTASYATATTSNTWYDPSLSVAITPTLSTSEILVLVTATGGGQHNLLFRTRLVQTISGGSAAYPIIGDAATSNIRASTAERAQNYNDMHCAVISYLDDPDTTSEIEYKIEISTDGAAIAINRPASTDVTDAKNSVTASTITAIEIATGIL
mgnify:CR=1 FL=1